MCLVCWEMVRIIVTLITSIAIECCKMWLSPVERTDYWLSSELLQRLHNIPSLLPPPQPSPVIRPLSDREWRWVLDKWVLVRQLLPSLQSRDQAYLTLHICRIVAVWRRWQEVRKHYWGQQTTSDDCLHLEKVKPTIPPSVRLMGRWERRSSSWLLIIFLFI